MTVTSYEPVATVLSSDGSGGNSSSTDRAIIAGSVVGAIAFLSLALALVLFYRRHSNKKLNFFRFIAPKPRSMLLAGEDLDDYDLTPPMQSYEDYPRIARAGGVPSRSPALSLAFSAHTASGSLSGAPLAPNLTPEPVMRASPHFFPRASESGSIFQEAVWPPPRALVDPLAGSHDDLGRIVDDIMGPAAASAPVPIRGHAAHDSDGSAGTVTGHHRTGSSAALLGGADGEGDVRAGSPVPVQNMQPLFVTNASPPEPSPLQQPRNWLERSPRKPLRSVEGSQESDTFPMGEAL